MKGLRRRETRTKRRSRDESSTDDTGKELDMLNEKPDASENKEHASPKPKKNQRKADKGNAANAAPPVDEDDFNLCQQIFMLLLLMSFSSGRCGASSTGSYFPETFDLVDYLSIFQLCIITIAWIVAAKYQIVYYFCR